MVTKATKRKLEDVWHNQCAICGNKDFLEIHHITPKASGGTDDYDNLILLCASCHAIIHNRAYHPSLYNNHASIDYEKAKPILSACFSNEIGAKETKEKLNLSQNTHLTECYVYKRYKRENNIGRFYNNVDLINSKRRNHVSDST